MSHQALVQLAGRAVAAPRKISSSDHDRFHVVVRIALNSGYYDHSGSWVSKEATFLDVSCWGDLAKNVLVSVSKGTPLIVLGKMETRSWVVKDEQGKDVTRSALSVYASHIGPDLNEREVEVIKAKREAEESQHREGKVGQSEQKAPSFGDQPREENQEREFAMAGAPLAPGNVDGAEDTPF